MTKIAFIGLGLMGRPMAERLLDAGFTLTVHNRSRGACEALAARGAVVAGSPAEAVADADMLITSLPTPEAVGRVYLGTDGASGGARRPMLWIDTSTVDLGTTQQLISAAERSGHGFIDAPVSGGPWGAAAGSLTIMAGATEEDLMRARPAFAVLGSTLRHVGGRGAGTVAKLCNQILTGVTHVLVAEVMVLAARTGIDLPTLYETLKAGSGQSNTLERAVPRFILPGTFEPGFAIDGIAKDLDCAQRLATSLGVQLSLLPIARSRYTDAQAGQLGCKDAAAVIVPMERAAGVQARA